MLVALLVTAIPTQAQIDRDRLTDEVVSSAIGKGLQFLLQQQGKNGDWPGAKRGDDEYIVGKSSLALMTLINCGLTVEDEPVQRALKYLREVPPPSLTYEVSLQLMAFAAVNDGDRDTKLMIDLATRLARHQIKEGEHAGCWSYHCRPDKMGSSIGDRSNTHFAINALRAARYANIPIDLQTWKLTSNYWITQQSTDGGWNYLGSGNATSTGSMTVAGISSQITVESIFRDQSDENSGGSPNCGGKPWHNESLDRGIKWLERNFTVGHNPGGGGGNVLYYLAGLERAGRLSGRRFFGEHDWYRAGAEFLIKNQLPRDGSWRGNGHGEADQVVATSFALQFLSNGLAPVLINKLQYASQGADPDNDHSWNQHRDDIRNLIDTISDAPGWPKLVTWQQLDLRVIAERGELEDLMVSPVLYISGDKAPVFNAADISLLRQYVLNGGFILGIATGTRTDFDRGFRDVIRQMYPVGESPLKRLTAEHPVFSSAHVLIEGSTELWGVDVGGRTSIIYSPHDIACLWDKRSMIDPPNRSPQMKEKIAQALRVGTNIMAYATNREPPSPLANRQLLKAAATNVEIEKAFSLVSKLKETRDWDRAPRDVRNLFVTLKSSVGGPSNSQLNSLIPAAEPQNYPLIYMHCRNSIHCNEQEQDRLRTQITRGSTLFADASGASLQFDKSFRELLRKLFPDHQLTRIPSNHELFATKVAHDLSKVRRREPTQGEPGQPTKTTIVVGEPFLEGIEINGRYVVIYSKCDLTRALLEQQAAVKSMGYHPEDAIRIAVNVVMYAISRE